MALSQGRILQYISPSVNNIGIGQIDTVWCSQMGSLWGAVVLNSFNMVYRDESNILDQKYEKLIFLDLYYEDFKFQKWLKKMHI